jgi:hypothetical protein
LKCRPGDFAPGEAGRDSAVVAHWLLDGSRPPGHRG